MMQPCTCDAQVVGVQDGAALEDLADLGTAIGRLSAVDGDLDAGGHEGALLGAAGQADAAVRA